MTSTDIIALVVTIIGVSAFAIVISILYKHYIDSSIREIKRGDRDIELIDKMIYENNKKVRRRQKGMEVVKNIAYYLVLAFLIPIFGLSIYSRIKDNVTNIGGNSVLVVASGSMSYKEESNTYLVTNNLNNQFNTYDMIVVAKVEKVSDLHVYDVIAYRNDRGVNIIHRIRDIQIENGITRFITRGDAVKSDDSYHSKFEDIIGVYQDKRIPSLGVFIMFFQSYAGIITVVSVVYTMIFISRFNRKLEEATYDREEILNDLFDVDLLNENTYLEMELVFEESLFYRGEVYRFNEDGFKEKRMMNNDEIEIFNKLQKEQDEIINAKQIKKEEKKDGREKE